MAANEQADRGGRQLGVFIIVHRLLSGSGETCRRVEKQSYFSRRRHANAPTRFPFPDL
jgi:hypothetical protein